MKVENIAEKNPLTRVGHFNFFFTGMYFFHTHVNHQTKQYTVKHGYSEAPGTSDNISYNRIFNFFFLYPISLY